MRLIPCTLRAITLAAALIPFASISVQAENITTDYDHAARFEQYHTFTFGNVKASNPLYEQRIRDQVTKDLGSHGWQMVPSGGDVTIVAIGGMSQQNQYSTFYNGLGGGGGGGFGWRRGWGGGGFGESTTTIEQIPVGTLVIDLYESGQHRLLFRGTASEQLSTNNEKNTGKLDKAIDKIFNKFPPKGAM